MKAIMYHYVRPDSPRFPHFRHLHIEDFRKQLDYFEANYDLIDRETFLGAFRSKEVLPEGCILTFDDGFKDHFKFVLPEFERRGIWGIFYVPTGMYSTGELLDVHRTHLLLGSRGGSVISDALRHMIDDNMLADDHYDEFQKLTYRTQSNDESTLYVKRCLNYFIKYKHRKSVLDSLMANFFSDEKQNVEDFYMNESEISAMQRAGMIIGSHSITHPVMSRLSPEQQEKEILDSFSYLEQVTGGLSLRTFCYPHGGFHTFTDATEQILDDAGCEFSFNVESRDISSDDVLKRRQALPRYNCNMFPYGKCRPLST